MDARSSDVAGGFLEAEIRDPSRRAEAGAEAMMGLVSMKVAGGLILLAGAAHAQQVGDPIVRAKIDPPRVMVGQSSILSIDVVAPNYMPDPPVLPDFQVRNLVTREAGAVNFVEQHDGTTYAGVRYQFALFPMEAGGYTISGQNIVVTYAAEPPQKRTVSISLQPVRLEAFIPQAAEGMKPFVASDRITIEQKVVQSSQSLKVGDSLTRTVTITADGIPAMLIPPVVVPSVKGLAIYPSQPALRDMTEDRSGDSKGIRIEQAIYLLQAAGDYEIPPLTLGWWNAGSQKAEQARAGGIKVHVADNPAVVFSTKAEGGLSWSGSFDWLREHWLVFGAGLIGGLLAIWNSPRLVKWVQEWYGFRQKTYRASEQFYFARLRLAARTKDGNATYFALLDWLWRFDPLARDRSVSGLKRASNDPRIHSALDDLEMNLFGEGTATVDLKKLSRFLAVARRRLQRGNRRFSVRQVLPEDINPIPMHNGVQVV